MNAQQNLEWKKLVLKCNPNDRARGWICISSELADAILAAGMWITSTCFESVALSDISDKFLGNEPREPNTNVDRAKHDHALYRTHKFKSFNDVPEIITSETDETSLVKHSSLVNFSDTISRPITAFTGKYAQPMAELDELITASTGDEIREVVALPRQLLRQQQNQVIDCYCSVKLRLMAELANCWILLKCVHFV